MDNLDPTTAGGILSAQRPAPSTTDRPKAPLPPAVDEEADSNASLRREAIVAAVLEEDNAEDTVITGEGAEETAPSATAPAIVLAPTEPPLASKEDEERLQRWLEETLDLPEPAPEQLDYTKEYYYLEYVVKKFSADLHTYMNDINKIGRLCVVLSNDWEHGTISNLAAFLGGDTLPSLVDRLPSRTMQRLIREMIVVLSQLLSRTILTLGRVLVSSPLTYVYEDSDLWKAGEPDEGVRLVLLHTLNGTSSEWRSYLEAIVQYHFTVTVPNNAHGLVFRVIPDSGLNIAVLREYAERQARLLPLDKYKTLGDLPIGHHVLEKTRALFASASRLYSIHQQTFTGNMLFRLSPRIETPAHFVETFFALLTKALDLPTNRISSLHMTRRDMAKVAAGGHPLGVDKHNARPQSIGLIGQAMRNVFMIADQDPPTSSMNNDIPLNHTLRVVIPMALKAARIAIRERTDSGEIPEPGSQHEAEFEYGIAHSVEMRNYLADNPLAVDRDLHEVLTKEILPTKEQQEAVDVNNRVLHQIFFGLLTHVDGDRAVLAKVNNGNGFSASMLRSYVDTMSEVLGLPERAEGNENTFSYAKATYHDIGSYAHPLGIMGTAHRIHRLTDARLNSEILEHEVMPTSEWDASGNGVMYDWMERVAKSAEVNQSIQDRCAPNVARFICNFQTHPLFPEFALGVIRDATTVTTPLGAALHQTLSPETIALAERISQEVPEDGRDYLQVLLEVAYSDERMATGEINGRGSAALCQRYGFPSSFANSDLLKTFVLPITDNDSSVSLARDSKEVLGSNDGESAAAAAASLEATSAPPVRLGKVPNLRMQDNIFATLTRDNIVTLITKLKPYLGDKMPEVAKEYRQFVAAGDPSALSTTDDSEVKRFFNNYIKPFYNIARNSPGNREEQFIGVKTDLEDPFLTPMNKFIKAIDNGNLPMFFTIFEDQMEMPYQRSLYCWFVGELTRIVVAFYAWQNVDLGFIGKLASTAGVVDYGERPLVIALTETMQSIETMLAPPVNPLPGGLLSVDDAVVEAVEILRELRIEVSAAAVASDDSRANQAKSITAIDAAMSALTQMGVAGNVEKANLYLSPTSSTSSSRDDYDIISTAAANVFARLQAVQTVVISITSDAAIKATLNETVTAALYASRDLIATIRNRVEANVKALTPGKTMNFFVSAGKFFGIGTATVNPKPKTLGECLANYLDTITGEGHEEELLLEILTSLKTLATLCEDHRSAWAAGSIWHWKHSLQTTDGHRQVAALLTILGTIGLPMARPYVAKKVTAAEAYIEQKLTAAKTYIATNIPTIALPPLAGTYIAKPSTPASAATATVEELADPAKPIEPLSQVKPGEELKESIELPPEVSTWREFFYGIKDAEEVAGDVLSQPTPAIDNVEIRESDLPRDPLTQDLLNQASLQSNKEFSPIVVAKNQLVPVISGVDDSVAAAIGGTDAMAQIEGYPDDAASQTTIVGKYLSLHKSMAALKKYTGSNTVTYDGWKKDILAKLETGSGDYVRDINTRFDKANKQAETYVKQYIVKPLRVAERVQDVANAELIIDKAMGPEGADGRSNSDRLQFVEARRQQRYASQEFAPGVSRGGDKYTHQVNQYAAELLGFGVLTNISAWSALKTAVTHYETLLQAYSNAEISGQDIPGFSEVNELLKASDFLKKHNVDGLHGLHELLRKYYIPYFNYIPLAWNAVAYVSRPWNPLSWRYNAVSLRAGQKKWFNPQKLVHSPTNPRYLLPDEIPRTDRNRIGRMLQDTGNGNVRANFILISSEYAFVNEETWLATIHKLTTRTAFGLTESLLGSLATNYTAAIPSIINACAPPNPVIATMFALGLLAAGTVSRAVYSNFSSGLSDRWANQVGLWHVARRVSSSKVIDDKFLKETVYDLRKRK